jgi:hypothetical protein
MAAGDLVAGGYDPGQVVARVTHSRQPVSYRCYGIDVPLFAIFCGEPARAVGVLHRADQPAAEVGLVNGPDEIATALGF